MDMAALIVQSRFAGLRIEDDENPSTSGTQRPKPSKNNSKKNEAQKKKNKPQTSKKRKAKQSTASTEQWEWWKQKDEEFVDANFESELQQAILLSKLDFEENEDLYLKRKKEADDEKLAESTRSSKKQKKKNVMSLEEFNDMLSGEEAKLHNDDKDISPNNQNKDSAFFDRIKEETRNEFIKDKINDRIKTKQANPEEVLTKVKYIDVLEEKEKEISALQLEVAKLKTELLTVKSRNKKLCSILGQGEMKDKAEILVEVERLRAVQTELTAEIVLLHSDLEKERSRNADTRTKDKQKKKVAFADKEK